MKVEDIAKVCHEANKAYCESIGDNSQPSWEDAPEWKKESAIAGVKYAMNPETTIDGQHNQWVQMKVSDGWVYGEEKSDELKTHPCIVSYGELPAEQQIKDSLFRAIVQTLHQGEDIFTDLKDIEE